MEWLQTVCNVIIIIGGACMAIKNVSEWLGKPIKIFRKRADAQLEDKIKEVLGNVLPEILYNHDLEVRDRYKADRQRYLQEIKDEVLLSMEQELGQVATLTKQYEALAISAKDVLREKIMQIYFKNRRDRTLTYHEREALDQYYIDYKAIKGNSYIDKYYNRMKLWQVVEDDYDEE